MDDAPDGSCAQRQATFQYHLALKLGERSEDVQ
jgi:hypothetical protein